MGRPCVPRRSDKVMLRKRRNARRDASQAGGLTAICLKDDVDLRRAPAGRRGNSGRFATTAAVRHLVTGAFDAWERSNLGERTVTIEGMSAMWFTS